MSSLPPTLDALIEELGRLPGIGPKSAQRIALALIVRGPAAAHRLADVLVTATERLGRCDRCGALAEGARCAICEDPARDPRIVLVVEGDRDVWAFERARRFRGTYHVLGGVISPMDGVGPDDLAIGRLIARVEAEPIEEVVVATSPTVEGETTATYLARVLAGRVGVSRLATGVPVGGELEYVDELTLARALEGRRPFDDAGPRR